MAAPIGIIPRPLARIAVLYPFVIVSLFLTLFFMISGPAIFPEWEELGFDRWIMVYLMFQIAALALARNQLTQLPLPLSAIWFIVGFGAGTVLFSLMFRNIGISQPFPAGAMLAVIAFQFVVATSEEVAFRGILVRRTGNAVTEWASIIIGAMVFAGFHWVAYVSALGVGPLALLQPFGFGVAMGYLFIRTKSISLAISLHWSYNLAVLGVSFF